MMTRLGLWVRSEWRNGWPVLLGLTVLIAIGGGVTTAAWAGARRADSAYDRFLAEVSGPLAISAAGIQRDLSVFDTAWADLTPRLAAIPGVTGVTPTSWMAVAFEVDGHPSQFFSVATGPGAGPQPPPGMHIVAGRPAQAADEVVINEEAAQVIDATIDDTIVLRSYAPDQLEAFIGSDIEADRGPRIEATVVGIFRGAEDISDNPEPFMFLPIEFYEQYADQIAHCDCSFWIGAATGDVEQVSAALPAVVGDYPLAVQHVDDQLRARVERAVGLEVGALQIAAVIAAVASGLVIVQALSRHISGRSGASALTAIGSTRPQIVRAWIIILAPAALLGSAGALALATSLSPLFPRGLARRAEIDPGLRFDTMALIGGGILLMLAVLFITAAMAWLTTRSTRATDARRARPGWLAHSRLSPPASLGASFALDPSRDRSRIVAVTAIAGLALAIGGSVAVELIDRSIADVLVTPTAFAADWDMELVAQPDDPDAVFAAIKSDESIEAFALQYAVTGNQFVITGPGGTGLVSPQTFDTITGSMGALVDQGRQPAAPDDVVLGNEIAKLVGADIGDEVAVDAGLQGDQTFRVSGIGRLSDGDETDVAFVTTTDGLARLQDADRLAINGAFVRLGDAGDATRARLEDLGFTPAAPPSRVATLGQIGAVPRLLAIALAALGLGGVIHGLLVAGSRRRSDIAIVRTLGFTPHQAASTIRWQGIVITVIATVIGVPLGLFVGRVIWKQVAAGVGATDLVSIPSLVLVIVPLATFVVVLLTASLIGRRSAQQHPATILRRD